MSNATYRISHLNKKTQIRSLGQRITSRHDLKSPLSRQFTALFAIAFVFALAATSSAQDWIRTGTGLGVEKVRLAAADFKPSTQDAKNADLLKTFDSTLWNDLDNAGIFALVSKSFYPVQTPGQPAEVKFADWASPPPEASMLAFGNLGVTADKVSVQGWLYDRQEPGFAAGARQAI